MVMVAVNVVSMTGNEPPVSLPYTLNCRTMKHTSGSHVTGYTGSRVERGDRILRTPWVESKENRVELDWEKENVFLGRKSLSVTLMLPLWLRAGSWESNETRTVPTGVSSDTVNCVLDGDRTGGNSSTSPSNTRIS